MALIQFTLETTTGSATSHVDEATTVKINRSGADMQVLASDVVVGDQLYFLNGDLPVTVTAKV
jgi:hypothetical protein